MINFPRARCFAALGLGLLLAACCGCMTPVVTKTEFDSVSVGMTYQQVEKAIGVPGKQMLSGELPPIPGVTKGTQGVIYTWINYDGSQMTAIFADDKLVRKTQTRLK